MRQRFCHAASGHVSIAVSTVVVYELWYGGRAAGASAYALEGDAKAASAELDAARKLRGQEFHSSIARRKSLVYFGVPAVVAQFDETFFAGLRKGGVPEE